MRKTLKIVIASLILLCVWGVSGVFAQSGTGRPFVTKWQGTKGEELKIPIVGTYKMVIKDENGNEKVNETVTVEGTDYSNSYGFTPTEDGTYTVEAGPEGVEYMRMETKWQNDKKIPLTSNNKLLEVVRFGTVKWESMRHMFHECKNMTFANGIDTPDLSKVTNMSWMFSGCSSFNQPLDKWKVSNVTNMEEMFTGCSAFNQPLNNWNVSNVKDMACMFDGCSAFNQPLNNWNVSKVTKMWRLFTDCSAFNQPLSNWKVDNVTDMGHMFRGCSAFNQPLGNWDVSKVNGMGGMFAGCSAFNQPLGNWDVSTVNDMERMFAGCSAFNQPLNNWNVSKVTDMQEMFSGCSAFNQPIGNWKVSKVTNMREMFRNCSAFNQPLDKWDVSNVTNMWWLFTDCSAFNQPLGNWNVTNVTNMSYMFYNCSAFNQPLDKWDVSNVTNMSDMFYNCSAFNQPINNWDVSNVTNMSYMFYNCSAFNQPLGKWKIKTVIGWLNGTAMSPSNYSATLAGWAAQNEIAANVHFNGHGYDVFGLIYNNEGKAARDKLIAKGWKFDGDIHQPSGVSITPRSLHLVLNKEFTLPLEKWGVEDTEEVKLSTDTEGIISYELTEDKKGVHIKGLKEGKCQLTATIAAKAGVHDAYTSTCQISVYIPIERITISPARKTLKVGEEFTLTANIFPENATKRKVEWSSEDSKIATVDSNGKVTVYKVGKCTINASIYEYGHDFYGRCEVTVEEPSNGGNTGGSGENNGGGNGNNGGGNGGNNGGNNGNNGGGDNNGSNPMTFTVTLTQPANGKIEIEGYATKSSITVAKDTKLTVKATPNEGYKLKSLKAGDEDITTTQKFTVKAATTVTALFEKQTFAVTTSVNNEAWGSITLTGASDLKAVAYGTELTVKVTEKEGYKLKSLTVGDKDITTTRKFTVKAATEVKAVFENKQGGAVEDALLAGIVVAPNPFAAQLRILNPEGVTARYELVNASGVVVRSGALSGSEAIVDTEALPTGIYFVRLEAQNGARKNLMVSK